MLQISKYRILGFLDSSDPTQEGPTVLTKGLSTELVECWKAIKELSIFFGHIFPTISLGSFRLLITVSQDTWLRALFFFNL